MLILLQLRGRPTAQALADEFEVSVRTIYRDADALGAAGVPVHADRGPGGGFRLLDGYRTRLTGLTPGGAETLLLAGLPGPAADPRLAEPLAAARLKLLAALPPAAGDGTVRVGGRFPLDPANWHRRAPPVHRPAIAKAVWDGERLAVRYESWSATLCRTIDPLGLVMKTGSWYLVARTDGSLRTYKIEGAGPRCTQRLLRLPGQLRPWRVIGGRIWSGSRGACIEATQHCACRMPRCRESGSLARLPPTLCWPQR